MNYRTKIRKSKAKRNLAGLITVEKYELAIAQNSLSSYDELPYLFFFTERKMLCFVDVDVFQL